MGWLWFDTFIPIQWKFKGLGLTPAGSDITVRNDCMTAKGKVESGRSILMAALLKQKRWDFI